MAVTEGLQLNPQSAFELIRRARAGESLKQLSKEFSVPEEEIKQLIGKKAANLTYEERKKRNELILKEFVENPEKCQEGRLRSFCEELGAKYNLSWRQVHRLFKKNEESIRERRTKTTINEVKKVSFESCKTIEEFIRRKRHGITTRKVSESQIKKLVRNLKYIFEDYGKVAGEEFAFIDPADWEFKHIARLMELYEQEELETYTFKGAWNQLVKTLELGKPVFSRSPVSNGSYRPGKEKPKQPLNSEEVRRVLSACLELYETSNDEVEYFISLLPERYEIAELSDIFLKEALKIQDEFTLRDYKFWKMHRRRKSLLENHFQQKVAVINKKMVKIESKVKELENRLKLAKKGMNLLSMIKLMTTTGLRHGSVERTLKITESVKGKKRAHGLEGLKFSSWNFNRSRWTFTVSEKWHDWKDVPITKDVQLTLERYFRLLSKEERALDQYCFKTWRLKKDLMRLTEACGLGEYKRGWFIREEGKFRRRKKVKEVPEGTPGAQFGIIRDSDEKYVMLWGRHLHAHLLRSSFATILYREKGLSVEKIAKLGHWKNLQTLWDHYIVFNEHELLREIEKLEDVTKLEGF